jgi:hypothetical protein
MENGTRRKLRMVVAIPPETANVPGSVRSLVSFKAWKILK